MTSKNGQRKDRELTLQKQQLIAHANKVQLRGNAASMELEQVGEGWTDRPPNIHTFLRMLVLSTRMAYLSNVMAAAQHGQLLDPTDTLDEDMAPLARYLTANPELAEQLWEKRDGTPTTRLH